MFHFLLVLFLWYQARKYYKKLIQAIETKKIDKAFYEKNRNRPIAFYKHGRVQYRMPLESNL